MTRTEPRRGARGSLLLALCAMALASCAQQPQTPEVAVTAQPQLGDLAGALEEQCGLDIACKGDGLLEGNGSISGVASIDAFFQSVVGFEKVAANVSGGIEAELEAIRADFGIAAGTTLEAGLKAQIDANLEAGLDISVEPAKCQVDAMATLEAQAKCDASVKPGSAMVKCEGSCEVDASAMASCTGDAKLECTATAPSIECTGECTGTCTVELSAAAKCEGTCKGTCSGKCEGTCQGATDAGGNCDGTCEGSCGGECQGSCSAEVAASAGCSGKCEGECKTTAPEAGCEAGAKVECKAEAGAMVDCQGKCDGKIEPPMAKAECQASAKADASLNVECSPPRVAINYTLKAGVDAAVQARFEAALKTLATVRLPSLMAKLKKANLVIDAGADVTASASSALEASFMTAAEGSLQAKFGVVCAIKQLPNVGTVIGDATGRLNASVMAAGEVTAALGV